MAAGRDINGTYVRGDGVREGADVCAQQKAAGVKVTATVMDAELNNIATALTNSLDRTGATGGLAGDINAGGFKIQNAGSASARTEYVTLGQLQDGNAYRTATTGGTAPNYTLSLNPPITALVNGMILQVGVHATTISGPITLNVNGLGAKTVTNLNGDELHWLLWRGQNQLQYDAGGNRWLLISTRRYKQNLSGTSDFKAGPQGGPLSAITCSFNRSSYLLTPECLTTSINVIVNLGSVLGNVIEIPFGNLPISTVADQALTGVPCKIQETGGPYVPGIMYTSSTNVYVEKIDSGNFGTNKNISISGVHWQSRF